MTIGQLRKRLEGWPADFEVWVVCGEYLRPVDGAVCRRIGTLETEVPGGLIASEPIPDDVVLLLRADQ